MAGSPTSCLRPELTTSLAYRLMAGEMITLISPHGQGRRRTLSDLGNRTADSLLTIQLNMQIYQHDFRGFLTDISKQAEHPEMVTSSFSPLLDQLTKAKQNVLIILHNFDELRECSAAISGYNCDFFNDLNSIRQRTNISLLSVCEQHHANYLLQHDGSELSGSSLVSELLQLPALTHQQLLAELVRRTLPVRENDLPELTDWLLKQTAPYSILDRLNPDWFKQKGWLYQ